MTDANRYETYLRIVETLMGEKVPFESRVRRYFVARMICVYQMHLDGYRNCEIERQCGKSNHSTINMIDEMRFILDHPGMYQEEMKLWKQFQKRIDNDIHN